MTNLKNKLLSLRELTKASASKSLVSLAKKESASLSVLAIGIMAKSYMLVRISNFCHRPGLYPPNPILTAAKGP